MGKPKTKHETAGPKPPTTTLPQLPEGAHDLVSLAQALGQVEESFRRLLLRNYNEQAFYEWGVQADTGNILSDMPRFVSSSVRILTALDEARRQLVMVPRQIFGVIVSEAQVLETMHRDHQAVATSEAGDKEDREAALKRLSGAGVALRNRVLASLRSAVGDARTDKVRKAANDASSADALVTGMRAVAKFIEDTLENGTGDDKTAMEAFSAGAACAAELRDKAAEIETASVVTAVTGKRVSKRALDIQDGRVLVLVDMVHRAFRLARRSDKSILLPELNRLASLFDTGSSTPAAKDSGTPNAGAPPAGPTP